MFIWLEKAAKQNYTKSQYKLSINYLFGFGVEADRSKALYF
ncbi:SEL1-like repeat protein [Gilliamella apicola]